MVLSEHGEFPASGPSITFKELPFIELEHCQLRYMYFSRDIYS